MDDALSHVGLLENSTKFLSEDLKERKFLHDTAVIGTIIYCVPCRPYVYTDRSLGLEINVIGLSAMGFIQKILLCFLEGEG